MPQRLSRIPPHPYTALVWLVSGGAVLTEAFGRSCEQILPSVFLARPTRHGWCSLATSAYRSFGVVFQPAAFALLTGLESDALELPRLDARDILGASWHGWIEEVAEAPDHATRIAACESFLLLRWRDVRPAPTVWERLNEHAWSRSARSAALGALNWTARHFQRRSRMMTGLQPGEVERMIRLERALRDLRDTGGRRAEIAAAHGYADQPHFTRDVRRAYGRSPGELLEDVHDADNHQDWLLRL